MKKISEADLIYWIVGGVRLNLANLRLPALFRTQRQKRMWESGLYSAELISWVVSDLDEYTPPKAKRSKRATNIQHD